MQNGEIAKRPVIHPSPSPPPVRQVTAAALQDIIQRRGVVGVRVEKEKSPADDDADEAESPLLRFFPYWWGFSYDFINRFIENLC